MPESKASGLNINIGKCELISINKAPTIFNTPVKSETAYLTKNPDKRCSLNFDPAGEREGGAHLLLNTLTMLIL